MASKKKNNLRRQVRRDVRAAYKPVLQGLSQQKDVAKEQRERDLERVGNIYGNLTETFNPLNKQFINASKQILAGAGGALGGSGMEPAMQELLGAMGQGHVANLATGMTGTLGNIAGLQAGALANRADVETNVMNRYRDLVNDISMQKGEVKAARAQTFLDELQKRKEYRLALGEQKLRAEQFDKEFGLSKRELDRKAKWKERQAEEEAARERWVLSQAQEMALDKKRKEWRKALGIPEIRVAIEELKKSLRGGPYDAPLLAEIAELEAQLENKRSKMQRKARRYKKRLVA